MLPITLAACTMPQAHRMVFVFFHDNPFFRNRMIVKQYPVEEDISRIRGRWSAQLLMKCRHSGYDDCCRPPVGHAK